MIDVFDRHQLTELIHVLGTPEVHANDIVLRRGGEILLQRSRVELHRIWSETSWQLQRMRDNPVCADQEYDELLDTDDPGLHARLTFDPQDDITVPYLKLGTRPRVAILREQGVNGQVEMAAAFDRAGFAAIDVHMSDLVDQRVSLKSFAGFVACGGFSFGDVLGAGEGWAKSIMFDPSLRDRFAEFFADPSTFALGVCNGCQMISSLRDLIPGAEHWPRFVRNASEQFEARLVLAEVVESQSILLSGMQGSIMPIVVAHGEGRAEFDDAAALEYCIANQQVALRFVDHHAVPTERYPCNPNGSVDGITGLSAADGRVTIMMPHPERVFRSVQYSWAPKEWGEDGPWLRLFRNARVWLD